MQIYVLKNDEKIGPLEIEEVQSLLAEGKLSPDDQAWHEGAANWEPLSSIPGAIAAPKAPAAEVNISRGKPAKKNPKPMSSVSRDLRKLKANTAATAGELSGFISEIRGSSPREMLGAIAQSSLMRSLLVSVAVIVFLLTTVTGLAFLFGEKKFIPSKPKDASAALFHALDTNGDLKLSAEEIADAPEALLELDDNEDLELTGEEFKIDDLHKNPPPVKRDDNATTLVNKGQADPAQKMGVSGKNTGQPADPNVFDSKTGGSDILDDLKQIK